MWILLKAYHQQSLLIKNLPIAILHSEVDTLRRVELLRELRSGEYDVLIGINF